jgi:hypothetical protein
MIRHTTNIREILCENLKKEKENAKKASLMISTNSGM